MNSLNTTMIERTSLPPNDERKQRAVRGRGSYSVNYNYGDFVYSFSFRDKKIAEQFKELMDSYCFKIEMNYEHYLSFREVKDENPN